VATIKEVGTVVAYEFKEGNDVGGRADIIRKAFVSMPQGKTIRRVLLDSEYITAMKFGRHLTTEISARLIPQSPNL